MLVTMDRYEADWRIVERGWNAHVHGNARRFPSATAAIETFRSENPGISDQNLPAFVIEKDGAPVGPIRDGDAVIFFNFRGDRAIEISRAFDDGPTFDKFDRGVRPDVLYAGMMEYDGDLHIPKHYLVSPPEIERPMGEILAGSHISQLAISETQKYGHVTYFWNGNRSGMFDSGTETYVEIPSDRVPFEQRPWMKAAEITDRLIAELRTGKHQFARVNYANGDMVGHTGSFDATVIAVEAVDLQLARLAKAIEDLREKLNIPANLKACGVKRADFEQHVDAVALHAFDDQCTGANPRSPLVDELREILVKAYGE
jgi:2,3-bisphosphoglycerate-independent phosphoglycerate mutase